MSERDRRSTSGAHPGNVVNNAKQKRRTREEIDRDNLAIEERKAEKQRAAAEKRKQGVRRVAAVEEKIRQNEEQSRSSAARPDLVTARLKCTVVTQSESQPEEVEAVANPPPSPSVGMTVNVDETMVDFSGGTASPAKFDNEGSDVEDADYNPDSDASRAGSGGGSGSGGDEDVGGGDEFAGSGEDGDNDIDELDDDDRLALEELRKKLLQKKKAKETASTKPKRGEIRAEIHAVQEAPRVAKRKNTDSTGPQEHAPKKPKAALGGLKAGWEKEVGVKPMAKKSSSTWKRSMSRGASSTTSVTSGVSRPSSVAGDDSGAEFDQDEDQASLSAARAAKGKAATPSRTSKMGITLKKKVVDVDVDGKAKRENKRKYINADLPFPADSHAVDLKHFQQTFIPDLIDWAATLDDSFAVHVHPDFKPMVEDRWMKYFSAYPISDAVHYMAVSAVSNWRSAIGKRALKLVCAHLKTISSARERRNWVAEQTEGLAFLYREPQTKGGSYRSELIVGTFSSHTQLVSKSDVSFGHPTGAMSLCAAALERAFSLCKDGNCIIEALPRKGRKSVSSFVPNPWAERARKYLVVIKTLSLQKWQEIIYLALTLSTDQSPDILESTDGDSSEGLDPRSLVIVSDDEQPP
ncbi:hypothetical protein C8R44DRAFT_865968 [Mycena epipterygia]|nr:hypothetical protein C8R44DRAFT_865968 [Mycena epipterygia]